LSSVTGAARGMGLSVCRMLEGKGMIFAFDARTEELRGQLQAFIDEHIIPAEKVFEEQAAELAAEGRPSERPLVMEDLKAEARKRGLWNLFLAHHPGGRGPD
jgi:acyl-CoA dehydrogenase